MGGRWSCTLYTDSPSDCALQPPREVVGYRTRHAACMLAVFVNRIDNAEHAALCVPWALHAAGPGLPCMRPLCCVCLHAWCVGLRHCELCGASLTTVLAFNAVCYSVPTAMQGGTLSHTWLFFSTMCARMRAMHAAPSPTLRGGPCSTSLQEAAARVGLARTQRHAGWPGGHQGPQGPRAQGADTSQRGQERRQEVNGSAAQARTLGPARPCRAAAAAVQRAPGLIWPGLAWPGVRSQQQARQRGRSCVLTSPGGRASRGSCVVPTTALAPDQPIFPFRLDGALAVVLHE